MNCGCYSKNGKCLCVLGCDCLCHEGVIIDETGTYWAREDKNG